MEGKRKHVVVFDNEVPPHLRKVPDGWKILKRFSPNATIVVAPPRSKSNVVMQARMSGIRVMTINAFLKKNTQKGGSWGADDDREKRKESNEYRDNVKYRPGAVSTGNTNTTNYHTEDKLLVYNEDIKREWEHNTDNKYNVVLSQKGIMNKTCDSIQLQVRNEWHPKIFIELATITPEKPIPKALFPITINLLTQTVKDSKSSAINVVWNLENNVEWVKDTGFIRHWDF